MLILAGNKIAGEGISGNQEIGEGRSGDRVSRDGEVVKNRNLLCGKDKQGLKYNEQYNNTGKGRKQNLSP